MAVPAQPMVSLLWSLRSSHPRFEQSTQNNHVKALRGAIKMKKHVKDESLLNTLARGVGRAAGTIAKATQDFADDAAAMVKTVKAEAITAETVKARTIKSGTSKTKTAGRRKSRRAPALAVRNRAAKRKAGKSVTRRSRTRA
jgi:hypothetical protein